MAYIGNDPSNIQRGRRAQYHFTATASQTSFSGTDDDGLQLDLLESVENDVYLNGARLVLDDDYTISGNTLTLTAAASAGDILVVVTQDDIVNLNSYTKGEADSRYLNIDGDIVNGDIQVVGNIDATSLAVDTDVLYVDSTNNRVGIKNSGTDISGTSLDDVVIGAGSTVAGIVLDGGASSDTAYGFASAGTKVGRIQYINSSNSMIFQTDNANRMTIDGSGRVKIGTTSNTPASANEPGFVFGDNTAGTATAGVASFVANSAAPLLLTRRINDGNVLGIADDTTTRGLLRVDGGDLNVSSNANLRLSAGGSSAKMTILSGGTVGIGTTTPDSSTKLHIKNDSGCYLSIDAIGSQSSNGNASISFYNDASNKADIIFHRSGLIQDLVFRNNVGGQGILFRTSGNNDRMYINSSGNVGIGTISPLSRLHVNDTSSAFYMGYGSNQDIYLQTTNGNILFTDYNAANERMRITSTGRVGIGTTNPQTELQVDGTVYATAVDHGDGSSADRAATSALEILRYYGKKPSGNYWIKEPNNGTPRQIYCDMETDGGGWMLWLEYNTSQNSMGAQASTQTNLHPDYNNGYANYEVMLDGSDVNNINKRSIRGVYELDANGEIRANGMRQWGEHHLPEHVGNPFTPNVNTFFNDAADGEFIQRTQYYAPLGGASPGWTSIGSGSLYVYVREPNPLVRNGDIKTYYGMPLVYDYYDSTKYGWHVPDYAYATGELGMSPGFSGIVIDGTDFPIASGYANRRIDVNNGNNGPSAQAMLRGYLIGEFQIRFYLGYRWGWSELILVDVKHAYESKYLGGAGSNIQKNLYRVMNNNSNNIATYVGYDAAGTQTVVNGTSYSEGQTWVMWREQNGNIYVKDPGGTSRNLGKFVGPMVAMSGSQSPHVLEIRDVWSRGRNSVTSNNAGTNTQFRH